MASISTDYCTNFQFRGSGLVVYNEYIGNKHRQRGSITFREQKNLGQASGTMTHSSLRRCKKYLDLWYNAIYSITKNTKNPRRSYAKFLTFVTLTLPSQQQHSDKFIKRQILSPFISELQRLHHVRQYLWKAEPQDNGNIHFHILIDKYIRHDILRWSWNRFLTPYNYIAEYTAKRHIIAPLELKLLSKFQPYAQISVNITRMRYVFNQALSDTSISNNLRSDIIRFQKYLERQPPNTKFENISDRIKADQTTGFNNPNSTDIHSPGKIKNLCCYVLKYLSKKNSKKVLRPAVCFEKEEYEQMISENSLQNSFNISGRVWGCSDGLRKLNYFITTEDSATQHFIEYIEKNNIPRIFEDNFFRCLSFNLYEQLGKHCKPLFSKIKEHFSQLFYLLYPPDQNLLLIT